MAPDKNQAKERSGLSGVVIAFVAMIALIAAIWIGSEIAAEQTREQAVESVRQSVLDAAMQCFAIEGVYPPSIKYMEDNYGLTVNQDEYVILYDIFAGNIPPIVRVSAK